jgi:hypothetical protein
MIKISPIVKVGIKLSRLLLQLVLLFIILLCKQFTHDTKVILTKVRLDR